jgi:small nuclear ribonucleoprotein (snRNP)-like protein
MDMENAHIEELKKAIGKEVLVIDYKDKEYKGILKSMNFNYGHVVLMTSEKKIFIRNVDRIERIRENQ